MSEVERRIAEQYPGVVLDSAVQGWAFLEDFRRGIEAYGEIAQPTPADDRWLGVCHFQLFEDLEALEALYRAVARGEEGARVNLAHLLRFLERADEAAVELKRVVAEELNRYDQVLFFRVRSLHEEYNGNLREALRLAEEAWRRTQGVPEFGLLAPSILSQLGLLHGRTGRSQRALWFLERGLQITEGVEKLKVRIHWASVLINLGRFQEARSEIESWDFDRYPDAFLVAKYHLLGLISWSVRDIPEAISHIDRQLELAIEQQTGFEEFLARLSLTALLGSARNLSQASEHLARAQTLISDRSDRLSYRFREILLLQWREEYSAEHALAELGVLADEFGEMGLLQEQGWVRLHMASLLLRLGDERYRGELDVLQALAVTLQNTSFLAREWTLVPELQKVAQSSHPNIAGTAPEVLEVYSLGEERLMIGKRPVNIPLRRGVEVLTYFLEHKAVSLKRLVAEVFPDEKYRSAKAYFHQFRHQLKSTISGLEIEYDREARLYRLKSEIDIVWDVAELRAGRLMGEPGLFLPSSGNEWALLLDQLLDEARRSVADGGSPVVSGESG